MRMYALPLTITLLSVIALAQCGTLRQYGRDWLIPKPDPQVDSKRITAKSVFIAPSFSVENVRCGAGFQQDATGRCVKVVHVNQAAQLDFLLQRLNAMYGAPAITLSEKQPLQVNVEIPVESENDTSSEQTGGIYSHMSTPEGGVSIDLFSSIADHVTKDTYDVKTSEENTVPQVPYGQTVLPESEEQESDVIVVPSKELFHVDEEPIVMLADDDDRTEISPYDSNKSSHFEALFEEDDTYVPSTVIYEETDVMAAIGKNESSVIKNETDSGKDPIKLIEDSEIQTESEAAPVRNQTQSDLANGAGVTQSDKIVNNTQNPFKESFHSDDVMKELSAGEVIVYNKLEPEDEMENMLPSEQFDKNNRTFSTPSEVAAQGSASMLMSSDKSSDPLSGRVPSNATTEQPVQNSPMPPVLGGLSNPGAHGTVVKQTEQDADTDYRDSDSDFVYQDVDPEVVDDSGSYEEGLPVSVSTETSAMLLTVNKSVATNSSGEPFDIASGDGNLNAHEYSGDSEDIGVNFNQSVNLNSTNTFQKTESGNSFNVPSNDRTNFDVSFPVGGVNIPSKHQSYVNGGHVSHFDSSSVALFNEKDLKPGSSVHNPNNETQNLPIKQQTDSEEVQQVVTSQHSFQVVYPQPSIQVLNVKQDSHDHTSGVANSNEPKTEPTETADSNSPPHQFHNLSPNPLQHHNAHPVPYVPLPARSPELPHKYNGYPYPAQTQSHPYHQFHPQPVRPHQQSGFVRFPSDLVQEAHRSHPHAHAHRQEVAGNVVRFPQEESRHNDKYSRWGNWGIDDGGGGLEPQRRVWTPPENRRNSWHQNRPTRRRPQLSYY